jgi:predicted nucleotidyltransferase
MSLASLLFSDYRRRVLGLLLLHPDKHYHIREIARLTNTAAGTLTRELSKLTDVGILGKERVGNQVHYSANRACPIFEELASILRKTSGLSDVLAAGLQPLAERIELAFVFGSMASGRADAGSDIDLLIIGSVGFDEVVAALYPTQSVLGRELNPKVYSRAEWQQLVQRRGAFVQDVLRKPKLFIVGDKNELGES